MEVILLDSKNILTTKCAEFPAYVEFQINSICNANCMICPYENAAKKFPSEQMSDQLIDKVICELNQHKKDIKRVIPYLNNEPSLDNRMIAVLRKIKAGGHFVELSTNMSGITNEKANIIVNEKLVDELRISFFGGSLDIYEMMMPGLNYYENISKISHLINLNNENGKPIDIKIVVILYPQLDCEENIKLISEIFPSVEICTFGFLDRADNLKGAINEKILKDESNNCYKLKGCDLNRPFERICILSNGKVIFCSQDWDREVELGNVLYQSIYEIWNGELFDVERERLIGRKKTPIDYLCRRCKLVHIVDIATGKERMNFLGDKYVDEEDEIRTDIFSRRK